MPKVLAAVPVNPKMPAELRRQARWLLDRMLRSNPSCDVQLCWFDRPFNTPRGEVSIFARPAMARNALLEEHLTPDIDYVLWLDADLVEYPDSLIEKLLACGPEAVTAPLVLIEDRDRFYDVAAFIEDGQPVFADGPHFGNVRHAPPYFVSEAPVVPCRSVGCCYILPAWVHRRDVQFEATPFTDHFPVVNYARQLGLPVQCAREIVVRHAELPRYGEKWHTEPMDIWRGWDFARYGLEVQPGRRPDAGRGKRKPLPTKRARR